MSDAKRLAVEKALINNLPQIAASFCSTHGLPVAVEGPLSVVLAEMVRFGVALTRYWDGGGEPPMIPALPGPTPSPVPELVH